MKNKISIIIPSYNSSKYIYECLLSVHNQKYNNFEVIIVDDCSTDNTVSIIKTFVLKDFRFKLICNKKHCGVSKCRNIGLSNIRGNYVTFIDSDDVVSKYYLSNLISNMFVYDADISIIKFKKIYDENLNIYISNFKKTYVYNTKDSILTLLYQKKYDMSLWGKLYKKELFNNIKFPINHIYEDVYVLVDLFSKSNKIVYSTSINYFYRKHSNSIMSSNFTKYDMDYINYTRRIINKFKDKELYNASISRFISSNISILIKKPSIKYRMIIYKNIKKYRLELLKNKYVRFKVKVFLIISYFYIH